MKRKLLAVLLVGLVAVLLTACKTDLDDFEKQSSEQDTASVQLIESQAAANTTQDSNNKAEQEKESESQEKTSTQAEIQEEEPSKDEVASTLESIGQVTVESNKKPTEQKEESKPEKEENKVTYQAATPESLTESKNELKKDKVDLSSEKTESQSVSSVVENLEKPQKPTISEATKELISKTKAKEIALSDAKAEEKDVRDFEIELDREKKATKYEVSFKANGFEYEYDIDANTGKILFENSEKDDDFVKTPSKKPAVSEKPVVSEQATASADTQKISKDEAKEIALSDAGVNVEDAKEFEIEFDSEDKLFIYEIEFKADRTEYKYEINAQNGKIIDKEIEKD